MSTTSAHKESNLIENCINGDRKSQKELYEMFETKMFSICLRYAKTEMDAEDILQEGFVKVFNVLDKFRHEGSFEGWVRKIFVNTAIEQFRRKNLNTTASEGIENLVADKSKNALDNLYERDLISKTHRLSDGYRAVFTMYSVEGYSHKEIAAQLGITESNSKSQLSRAKSSLRDILKGNVKHVA